LVPAESTPQQQRALGVAKQVTSAQGDYPG
jgi:hypothetical protein